MPEASRDDTPLRNPQYPQGAQPENQAAHHNLPASATETSLPPGDIYGQLPPTRAESFGRTVGTAVGGVLRFPQHVGQATSRLRRVGNSTRAEASAAVLDIMDTAAQRAEYLGRTIGEAISDWTHSARRRTSRLEDRAVQRWLELRSVAGERIPIAGRRAAARWNYTQRAVSRMQQEDPARFLIVVAGTAFVIGAGLRIWRSSSND